ncbi:MAG TPA: TRAM domain-containing protein [Nitrososphaerales archaeon]|nr:TRAM domain-containing protein [Nitrososphaerales archaeon]
MGKEYNVSISDTSRRGEGIARVDGFVVFVPGTKQGQNVRIKVTQVSDRFASGQVVSSPEATATPESKVSTTS